MSKEFDEIFGLDGYTFVSSDHSFIRVDLYHVYMPQIMLENRAAVAASYLALRDMAPKGRTKVWELSKYSWKSWCERIQNGSVFSEQDILAFNNMLKENLPAHISKETEYAIIKVTGEYAYLRANIMGSRVEVYGTFDENAGVYIPCSDKDTRLIIDEQVRADFVKINTETEVEVIDKKDVWSSPSCGVLHFDDTSEKIVVFPFIATFKEADKIKCSIDIPIVEYKERRVRLSYKRLQSYDRQSPAGVYGLKVQKGKWVATADKKNIVPITDTEAYARFRRFCDKPTSDSFMNQVFHVSPVVSSVYAIQNKMSAVKPVRQGKKGTVYIVFVDNVPRILAIHAFNQIQAGDPVWLSQHPEIAQLFAEVKLMISLSHF